MGGKEPDGGKEPAGSRRAEGRRSRPGRELWRFLSTCRTLRAKVRPEDRLAGGGNGPNILHVHATFNTVLWVVCVVAVIVALAALISTRKTWQDFGKNGLLMDSELKSRPAAGPAPDQERDEEIRQMMAARNARRARRGEAPLDVEQEIARLTPQKVDPELESEIRDLVKARNYRRTRAGKSPLNIEAEVQRELEKLRGL